MDSRLLHGRHLRRVLTPTQERLRQRGIVSKIATHLAERIYETLHVAECLDAQQGSRRKSPGVAPHGNCSTSPGQRSRKPNSLIPVMPYRGEGLDRGLPYFLLIIKAVVQLLSGLLPTLVGRA